MNYKVTYELPFCAESSVLQRRIQEIAKDIIIRDFTTPIMVEPLSIETVSVFDIAMDLYEKTGVWIGHPVGKTVVDYLKAIEYYQGIRSTFFLSEDITS